MELERSLFDTYKNLDLHTKPEELAKRGGAHYSVAAVNLMVSIHCNRGDTQTINVPNQGTLPFHEDDAFIEVNCTITQDGPIAQVPKYIPQGVIGLIKAVDSYERGTIEAAVAVDPKLALLAFAHHPLCISVHESAKMITEMFERNSQWLKPSSHTNTLFVEQALFIELSGGEWQKLALARSIFRSSDLIIFDEPTGAIDPMVEDKVLQKIIDLSRDRSCLVISQCQTGQLFKKGRTPA